MASLVRNRESQFTKRLLEVVWRAREAKSWRDLKGARVDRYSGAWMLLLAGGEERPWIWLASCLQTRYPGTYILAYLVQVS